MTREEAIRILDPETRRETMKAITVHNRIAADQEACQLAVVALRTQQELESKLRVLESNEPLTLDELRKMDNQPVWIEDVGEYKWHGSGWAIVDREHCLVRKASNGNPAFFERYGKGWIAYRQKPEEGTV